MIAMARKEPGAKIGELEIDTLELFCLIREIETTEDPDERKEIKKRFKVGSKDNSATIFDFFNLAHNFVVKWVEREYIVTYKEVPILLLERHRDHL